MRKIVYGILASLFFTFIVVGCGGGDSSTPSSKVKVGYLIDAPISGVTYECDGREGITDSSGKFECENPPVVFKIGSLVIGTLDSFTADSKVYPQDLLGLSRSNFTDPALIALVRLLQGLDDDGNYANVINIPKEKADKFTEDENFDADKVDEYAATAGVDLISAEDAIKHLKETIIDVEPTELDLSGTHPGSSELLSFDDAFIALEEVYYALECEDVFDAVSGEDKAQFSLVEKKLQQMGLPLSIDNESLIVDAGRIKMVYTIVSPSDYMGEDSILVSVSSYLDNVKKSTVAEVWYYVGDRPVGFNDAHEPVSGHCGTDGARDIDVISNLWYTVAGQNTWLNKEHMTKGSCSELTPFIHAYDDMQMELDRWVTADCPAYQFTNY